MWILGLKGLKKLPKKESPKDSKLQIEVTAQDSSSSPTRLCLQPMLRHTLEPLIVIT